MANGALRSEEIEYVIADLNELKDVIGHEPTEASYAKIEEILVFLKSGDVPEFVDYEKCEVICRQREDGSLIGEIIWNAVKYVEYALQTLNEGIKNNYLRNMVIVYLKSAKKSLKRVIDGDYTE